MHKKPAPYLLLIIIATHSSFLYCADEKQAAAQGDGQMQHIQIALEYDKEAMPLRVL